MTAEVDGVAGSDGLEGDERAERAASELVEVVDPDGVVVDVVARAKMRAERLRHRCTYIAVIDSAERLVVHQRAPWKDVWPGRWDVAFGGVVGVGEGWHEAAARELVEEAGIDVAVELIGTGRYEDSDVAVLGHIYVARHDGPIEFADGEVVAVDRVPLSEIDGWLAAHETTPDSVALLLSHVQDLRR